MDNVPVRTSHVAPVGAPHNNANNHGKRKKFSAKSIIISVVAVLGIAAIVLMGLFLYKGSASASIDKSKYQAVFLTSGQVYFGKLSNLGSSYATLTDVFYIQATSTEGSDNPQNASTDVTDLQLIKLGSEVHGPEDEMLIGREQILFVENLKADGKVSSSIKEYYKQLND